MDYTVEAPARISQTTLAAFLTSLGSPALPEVGAIYDRCVALGVDPAVAAAFFWHESGGGTAGRALTTKSWGNIRFLPIYLTALPYPVANVDGFCAYRNFAEAVDHFCRHLVGGSDGTNNYASRGLVTVSQIVPVYAPAADGNTPDAYIAAVNGKVSELIAGGTPVTLPKVLFIAGHVNIENITDDQLAPGTAARLRGSTGSNGERAWTGDFAQRFAAALNASGQVAASFVDAIWHPDVYAQDWALVAACHFHRDADRERAMAATVDPVLVGSVISADARAASQRYVDDFAAQYEVATGIPVTQDLVTLNMTQLYSWSYPKATSQMVCIEFGNANLDHDILYGADGAAKIVAFIRDSVIVHLGATAPAPPPVVVPPTSQYTRAQAAAELRAIADKLEAS